MNNQEKGLLYEKCVKDFIIQHLDTNAFLWNECPENILIKHNLVHSHSDLRLMRKDLKEGHLHNHKDIGIDIIQLDNNDKCSIVQCKNGYKDGLCISDLSGIMLRAALIRNINTYIYYTSCLSRNLSDTIKLSPYVVFIDYTNDIETLKLFEGGNDNKIYFVKLPCENSNISNRINEEIIPIITPYSYQLEAVSKLKDHYINNNRGIVAIPCGCGKTYISMLISNDYKQIVILSPLREFARQNLNRFIEYGYNRKNTLLVNSDGDRDIDSIKKFIQSNNKCLISTTYKSMDLISECLELFNDVLFIIDEFHNLSKANIFDKTDNIYKLLKSNHKILFMSATPRIYDIEYDDNNSVMDSVGDEDSDGDEDSVGDEDSDGDVGFFGDVVYQMTFTYAIANKYITDYRIWLPSIHENNEELDNELSIYEIDNEIKNRCKFLYSCIANNGSRKCIVYCKDTDDMTNMIESMKTLNDFYIMDIEMHSISCEDSVKRRSYVLEYFANNEKIQLLFNIRILNECIDIPACDSVYISYAPKNKITTIQRISRATRIDKNNPYKVANIYIWCEAYEEILETLSSIKEYDIMFKDKVKVSTVDFYNNKCEKELRVIEKDKVLLSDCIIGVKEFKVISWEEKLVMVKEYIREFGRLPTSHNTNKYVASLSTWISTQRQNYKKNKEIMNNKNIRKLWEEFANEYPELFKSNKDFWIEKKDKLEDYIKLNNKLPSQTDKDNRDRLLAKWKTHQTQDYYKRVHIMKNEDIRKLWEDVVNKYPELFKSNKEIWIEKKDKLEDYIKLNNKLPSQADKVVSISSLFKWSGDQSRNYKNKEQIMKDEDIRKLWEDVVNKYPELFKSNKDIWIEKKDKLEDYIKLNNKLPSQADEDNCVKKLARWECKQNKNYKKEDESMKDEDIRKLWEEFVNKYPELFKSNKDIWIEKKDKLEDYIQANNKLPNKRSNDKYIGSLGSWVSSQKKNYKSKKQIMEKEDIRKEWEDFTAKYPHLF
jgi:superfamily II DNA or RNA helicase